MTRRYIHAESRWSKYISVTWGTMPTFEEFERAFDEVCEDGEFQFGNDRIVGSDKLNVYELWDTVNDVWVRAGGAPTVADADADEAWVSDILLTLGWEWV